MNGDNVKIIFFLDEKGVPVRSMIFVGHTINKQGVNDLRDGVRDWMNGLTEENKVLAFKFGEHSVVEFRKWGENEQDNW